MRESRLNFFKVGVLMNSPLLLQAIVATATVTVTAANANANTNTKQCRALFSSTAIATVEKKTVAEVWAESVTALKQIRGRVYGRDDVIQGLTTIILAKEFAWINGDPGAAKTYVSRLMFQAVLNTIPGGDKKTFLIQFHRLISEGKIIGFQKFQSMWKHGRYEIETESSLVGDKYLFLIADEAEKAGPAVHNALLSVLNERKARLGSRVVDAILSSGVFTSNKTTGEFVRSGSNDRQSREALLDRQALKIHMSNQQLSPRETVAMYRLVKGAEKIDINLPLHDLHDLIAKVVIPDEMMPWIVSIARELDRYATKKTDQSRSAVRNRESMLEYFPANQFSSRSMRRLIQVFKSALIAKQLMEGVPFEQMRLKPTALDMSLLAWSALYMGPAGLKLKTYKLADADGGIQVKSPFGTVAPMRIEYGPYDGRLLVQDGEERTHFEFMLKDGTWTLKSQSPEFEGWSVDSKQFVSLAPQLQSLMAAEKIDLSQPKFEVEDKIDKLLAKGTVKKRTREELKSMKEDHEQFARILDRHFELGEDQKATPSGPREKRLPPRSEKEIGRLRYEMLKASPEERIARYYDWMRYDIKVLKQRFIELDHSIEAGLTSILAHNHLLIFGPPGGAKTALAEVLLKAELKKMNADEMDKFFKAAVRPIVKDDRFLKGILNRLRAESPQVYDRFFIQFHKLLPEGVLTGFPKVEKQMDEGVEEIEVSTSLANQKFVFAIFDEANNASPQTIRALFSILEEREIFVGGRVIKTNLKTAIQTSNFMPSEFVDAMAEPMDDSWEMDLSPGEAALDRSVNKVFVSNKISSQEKLVQWLTDLEKGLSMDWEGLLAIKELEPLVERVEFENPALEEVLATVHQRFLAKRIQREEETREAHETDPIEYPDYYVAAAGSASDRTVIKLFDQLKARFIIHQLMNDVAYKDLRTTIELKDLGLFFEGLGYWAPQKIVQFHDEDGKLKFKNDSHIIESLIDSGIVDGRVKYHLNMMKEEAEQFVEILGDVIREFKEQYNKEIIKYPHLFPSLFLDGQARAEAARSGDL